MQISSKEFRDHCLSFLGGEVQQLPFCQAINSPPKKALQNLFQNPPQLDIEAIKANEVDGQNLKEKIDNCFKQLDTRIRQSFKTEFQRAPVSLNGGLATGISVYKAFAQLCREVTNDKLSKLQALIPEIHAVTSSLSWLPFKLTDIVCNLFQWNDATLSDLGEGISVSSPFKKEHFKIRQKKILIQDASLKKLEEGIKKWKGSPDLKYFGCLAHNLKVHFEGKKVSLMKAFLTLADRSLEACLISEGQSYHQDKTSSPSHRSQSPQKNLA